MIECKGTESEYDDELQSSEIEYNLNINQVKTDQYCDYESDGRDDDTIEWERERRAERL
jgi:hypothetical protein